MIPRFTKNELFVMLQTIGTTEIVGVSNPFINLSQQEVEGIWEKTYKDLHKRGLVNLINEEVKLEERFADALWIMSRTNLTVEIVRDLRQKSLFYFGEENVIECTALGNNEYTLYMHGEPSDTWNGVIYPRMLAGIEERPIQLEVPILIPTAIYNDWLLNKKIPNSVNFNELNKNENFEMRISQLNNSIKQRIHNNRLMAFYKNEGLWVIEGIHVLTSPSHNWVLKMVNHNNIELLEARQSSNIIIITDILDVIRKIGTSELNSI